VTWAGRARESAEVLRTVRAESPARAGEAAEAYGLDVLRMIEHRSFNPDLVRLYARIAFRFASIASPWLECAVCGGPYDHGCNTAACSVACMEACTPCPVCDEPVSPRAVSRYCGAACSREDRARRARAIEEPLSAEEARQAMLDAGGL
jgi:hypothetical protein